MCGCHGDAGADGWQAAAGYSYYNDTRAQIFRRDQHSVTDLTSMAALMNKNDYQARAVARTVCS